MKILYLSSVKTVIAAGFYFNVEMRRINICSLETKLHMNFFFFFTYYLSRSSWEKLGGYVFIQGLITVIEDITISKQNKNKYETKTNQTTRTEAAKPQHDMRREGGVLASWSSTHFYDGLPHPLSSTTLPPVPTPVPNVSPPSTCRRVKYKSFCLKTCGRN